MAAPFNANLNIFFSVVLVTSMLAAQLAQAASMDSCEQQAKCLRASISLDCSKRGYRQVCYWWETSDHCTQPADPLPFGVCSGLRSGNNVSVPASDQNNCDEVKTIAPADPNSPLSRLNGWPAGRDNRICQCVDPMKSRVAVFNVAGSAGAKCSTSSDAKGIHYLGLQPAMIATGMVWVRCQPAQQHKLLRSCDPLPETSCAWTIRVPTCPYMG